jgi:hypothetical protein
MEGPGLFQGATKSKHCSNPVSNAPDELFCA